VWWVAVLKYLTLQLCPYRKSMACDEKIGDKNQLRNNLGDNRGTKIKREIPQLLIFNELRDFTVPRTELPILLSDIFNYILIVLNISAL